jgi:4-carboxymuconolactone decarboxylase
LAFGRLQSLGCEACQADTLINLKGLEWQQTTEDRYALELRKLREIDGHGGEAVVDSLRDTSADLGRYVIASAFGDVYSRSGLDLRSREIATVAALAAMGNARPQLTVHMHAALNGGVTREELIAIVVRMAVYAGFPAALNVMFATKEVFSERKTKG